ncbi:MAG: metallophosphoesterase [Paraprevotella sp.]|nr:metallophosphoesterase [Paraprevotella sp.]
MSKYINCIFFLLIVLFFAGCDMIEYHPYEARVEGETGINAKNINLIQKRLEGKKEFKFAMISDTQRSYDETKKVVAAINARGDISFVIHGGDQADFGLTKEFLWTRNILNNLYMPYVVLLGNHDCLGTGEDVYKEIYGHANFAFTAGNVRFVCLNTNALEYDYSVPVPDFDFIEEEINREPNGVEKTIVAMHVPPGDVEFNNNVRKPFERYLLELRGIQFCLYGHNHYFDEKEFFGDGLMYYGCTNVANKGYFVITIKEDGYEIEKCSF